MTEGPSIVTVRVNDVPFHARVRTAVGISCAGIRAVVSYKECISSLINTHLKRIAEAHCDNLRLRQIWVRILEKVPRRNGVAPVILWRDAQNFSGKAVGIT